MPRPGQVLGLVGANGTGKSTALKILAGKLKPNLGVWDNKPDWQEILTYFRGSELQNYFTKVVEDTLKTSMKPQYVDNIPKAVKGTVGEVMKRKDEREALPAVAASLELTKLLDHDIATLSGGELQRFAIGTVCVQDCDVYMFDEPSSYLDVEQRLAAARAIRELLSVRTNTYVIVVEHDLAVLDYLSDFVCVLYGKPGAYGVVTMPFGVREGINVFLAGFVPTENLRFRDASLTFKVSERAEDDSVAVERTHRQFQYPTMTKSLGTFALSVEGGQFSDSEIIVLLGQNGCGKCLARGTPVLLYDGSVKPVEAVRVGDTLMGDDNTPRKVLSLARGREEMARISRCEKSTRALFECNMSHVLTLKATKLSPVVAETDTAGAVRGYCANVVEVARDAEGVTTSLTHTTTTPFATEAEARAFLASVSGGALLQRDDVIDIAVRDFLKLGAATRSLFQGFAAGAMDFAAEADTAALPVDPYTVGTLIVASSSSHDASSSLLPVDAEGNSFLPVAYKTASRDARLRLLAGVRDACGGARDVRLRSASLAADVAFVARSLGQRVDGVTACHLCIDAAASTTFDVAIETLPVDEYFGFTLDGNARFVVGDELIVTHNTTLVRMLAGLIKPDDEKVEVPELNISYKPQKIAPSFEGTVRQLLHTKIKDSFMHPQFASDVAKPLQLESLLEQEVGNLSGGELQRTALVLALGKPADVYLIDEPSAYLDSEQRVIAAKVIKRFIMHAQKTAFIVEHDFIMATYLADRVIVYEGEPSVKCLARKPQSLLTGMNQFLQQLEITFRRDPVNYRPRINKQGSQMDSQQKSSGNFFFMDDDDEESPAPATGKTGKK
jgi:translation initiation factor RLI1